MSQAPLVIVTRKLPEAIEYRMSELFNVELWPHERVMNREELQSAVERADILVSTLTERIDRHLLAQASDRLKLIANYGAGTDHIDVGAAREKGIFVTNAGGTLAEDTADIAMALILALPRRLKEGMAIGQSDDWAGWSPLALLGHRISGSWLGVLGMGRSGQALAKRAQAFGIDVHYHGRRRLHPDQEKELGVTWWESFDQMLARVDFLSIHVPQTPATYHLVNARRIALMKSSAFVVNVARGDVVDENALTRAIRRGDLGGAGLDVHSGGQAINPRLKEQKNVILLPHIASATRESRHEMGERVMLNIRTYLDGHRPPDLVFMT